MGGGAAQDDVAFMNGCSERFQPTTSDGPQQPSVVVIACGTEPWYFTASRAEGAHVMP